MGYSLWGCKESDMTEQITNTHTDMKMELVERDEKCFAD